MATWYCGSTKWTAVAQWAAATSYSIGDIRRQLATPTVGNERVWRCTTAGTSGGSEPAWTLTKGSTTNDNTVVWTEITGSSTYNTNPSNMVAPHARIETAASWMAAGDTLYISNHHTQTVSTVGVTITFPGTLSSPNFVYVVDDTNATPTLSTGSALNTTSTGGTFVQGSVFWEASGSGGFVFNCGSGANTVSITLASTPTAKQVFKGVDFILGGTSGGNFTCGGAASGVSSMIEFYNCRLKFSAAASGIISNGKVRFYNLSFISGSTAVTNLVKSSGNGIAYDLIFEGCDLSNMGSASNLIIGGTVVQIGNIIFQTCLFPSAWSGLLLSTTYAVSGVRVEFHACSTGDTMFAEQVEDYTGNIVQETATYTRIGGASVPNSKSGGTEPQPFSWKFTPSSNCVYPNSCLKSSAIPIMDLIVGTATVGVPITLTAHALADQVAAITNAVFWMEVSYPGTSGSTAYTVVDNKPSTGLTTATSLSSGYGWTTSGMTNPQQVISIITFTPQEKGVILVRLCVGSSTPATLYVDPKIA